MAELHSGLFRAAALQKHQQTTAPSSPLFSGCLPAQWTSLACTQKRLAHEKTSKFNGIPLHNALWEYVLVPLLLPLVSFSAGWCMRMMCEDQEVKFFLRQNETNLCESENGESTARLAALWGCNSFLPLGGGSQSKQNRDVSNVGSWEMSSSLLSIYMTEAEMYRRGNVLNIHVTLCLVRWPPSSLSDSLPDFKSTGAEWIVPLMWRQRCLNQISWQSI